MCAKLMGYQGEGMDEPYPVRVVQFYGESATVAALVAYHVGNGMLPAAQFSVPAAKLVELPCRPCEGCLGFHHWMEEYLNREDPDDSSHSVWKDVPDAEDGVVIMICKHCEAWRPITADDLDDEFSIEAHDAAELSERPGLDAD
jgi:hypothetical protein